MYKLDKKDKAILYELDKNARQPLTKIARKIKLSRESILYRIKKYFEEGIVRGYLSVIDMAKLGFTHYKIYIKLHNTTELKEKKFVENLCKNPFVSWVANCDGAYSLIVGIKAKSTLELNKLLKEIITTNQKIIMSYDITTIVNARHFYRDYLINKNSQTERKIFWGEEISVPKLDNTNIIILDEISKNSRINSVEIADKLKISADAIIQRIKKLEEEKIIENYLLWPNVNKLIGIFHKVLITLKNLDEEKEKELVSYCLNNSNIVYIVNTIGSWQFEVDVEAKDITEFRNLMRDLLNKFSDIISNYQVLNIYEEHKFRFFEKEIFNKKLK